MYKHYRKTIGSFRALKTPALLALATLGKVTQIEMILSVVTALGGHTRRAIVKVCVHLRHLSQNCQ